MVVTTRMLYGAGFAACTGLIGTALFMQYGLELEPCPLCIVQRVVVIALGALCLIAAVQNPGKTGIRVYGALTVLVGGLGVAVAGRHVWLQNLPEEQVPECSPGLEYLLSTFPLNEAIEKILRGSGECSEVVWRFLGLTTPGWTLIAFSLFVMFGFWQLSRPNPGV